MIKKLFPSKKEAQSFLLNNAFLVDHLCPKGERGREYYKAKAGIYKKIGENEPYGYLWKSPFEKGFEVVVYGVRG